MHEMKDVTDIQKVIFNFFVVLFFVFCFLLNMPVQAKRKKKTFIVLYCSMRGLEGHEMRQTLHLEDTFFSDQFDYLCQQQVFKHVFK